MGFGVWGLGFGVWGLGFGVWGLGFGLLGAVSMMQVMLVTKQHRHTSRNLSNSHTGHHDL